MPERICVRTASRSSGVRTRTDGLGAVVFCPNSRGANKQTAKSVSKGFFILAMLTRFTRRSCSRSRIELELLTGYSRDGCTTPVSCFQTSSSPDEFFSNHALAGVMQSSGDAVDGGGESVVELSGVIAGALAAQQFHLNQAHGINVR